MDERLDREREIRRRNTLGEISEVGLQTTDAFSKPGMLDAACSFAHLDRTDGHARAADGKPFSQVTEAGADAAAEVDHVSLFASVRKLLDEVDDVIFDVPEGALAGSDLRTPDCAVNRSRVAALSVSDERRGVAIVVRANLRRFELR